MQCRPIRIAVKLTPLFERFVGLILQIGHQLGPLGRHRGLHFSADRVGCRLDLREPGKARAGVEFAFAQARVVEMGGLAVPHPGLAQHVIAKPADFPSLVVVGSGFARSGGGDKPGLALGQPGIAQRFASADRGRQPVRQRAQRPLRQCFSPSLASARRFELFEQPGAQGERDEIQRRMRQRSVYRVKRAVRLAQAAPQPGELKPGGIAQIGHGQGLIDQLRGAGQIAARSGGISGLQQLGSAARRVHQRAAGSAGQGGMRPSSSA